MELPEEILAVLPEDPFAQLDLAKKITSIALSSRVTSLELEITSLQQELNEVNNLVDDMSDQLTCSEKEKESLKAENSMLTNTVRRLSRDVSKLEGFRRTLTNSLQIETGEVDQSSTSLSPSSLRPPTSTTSDHSNSSTTTVEPNGFPPKHPSARIISQRHSFTGSRSTSGMVSPLLSAIPRSNSMSHIEKNRIDGKEFFRQVRTRLSPDQFSSFLSNIKELNSGKQSREETLQRAVGIFGPNSEDLCAIFQGLITR